jgi:hypothetical protein
MNKSARSSSMNKKGWPGNNDYVVGKGRPPVSTRFKPGQSGNPKGRPKGAKNLVTYIFQALNRKVPMKDGGRIRKVTSREGIAEVTVNRALKGDHKVLPLIIDLDRDSGAAQEREKLGAIRENRMPTTPQEALEAYRRTLRGEDE